MKGLKEKIEEALAARSRVVIEIGCGPVKKHKGAIGIDTLPYPDVDIVSGINDALPLFPSGSVHEVHSYHCFEHLDNLSMTIEQLARVMVSGGLLHVVVPHFSNPYYYSDPTHRTAFGLYTFSYFSETKLFKRTVPSYMNQFYFETYKIKLGFKSPRPFYGRWFFKRLVGWFFNLSSYTMELYEENLCYLIPCYEVEFWLRRNENHFA